MQIVQSQKRTVKRIDQSVVEYALAIPILLLGVLLLLEFGRMVTTFAFVNLASREGARYGASVGLADSGELHYLDCAGIREKTIRHTGFTSLNHTDINISYETGPNGSLKFASCEDLATFAGYDAINFGDQIVVEVSKDMDLILNYFGLNIEPITISSASSQSITMNFRRAGP